MSAATNWIGTFRQAGALWEYDGQGPHAVFQMAPKIAAVMWYRKAADKGYAPAQSNLGHMYQNGLGVTPDFKLSMEWYGKAAAQGDRNAKESFSVPRKAISLLPALSACSAGDLSVLEASSSNPGSVMSTVKDVSNDVLWSAMTHIGWTTDVITSEEIIGSTPIALTLQAYRRRPQGRS